MKTLKTILMVAVVAGALVAIPASAQTTSSEGDSSNAALMALVESQQAVIDLQQDHIESLEDLVESQRSIIRSQQALLDADLTHLVAAPAPEPEPVAPQELSATEMADAAVVCAGWRMEAENTATTRRIWASIVDALDRGFLSTFESDGPIPAFTSYRDQLTVVIPLLSDERTAGLMTALAEAIDEILKSITAQESTDVMAGKIRTGIERFDELESALAVLCDAA